MTPEERLAVLESRMDGIESWLKEISADQKKMLDAMNMSRGAWWTVKRFGWLLVLGAGAFGWLYDHAKH